MSKEEPSLWNTLKDIAGEKELLQQVTAPGFNFRSIGLSELLGSPVLAPFTTQNGTSSFSVTSVAVGISVAAVVAVGVRPIIGMVSWQRTLRDSKTNGAPPGPPPLPFLGNMLQLRSGYYETLYEYVDRPASVFWVLSTPFVVINDEEGLRRVLGGAGGRYMKPKYFGYKSRAVKVSVQAEVQNVAKESIEYLPDGDNSRAALENMVRDSFSTICSSMQELLQNLEEASEAGDSAKREEAVGMVRKAIVGLNLDVLFGLTETSTNAEDPGRISNMIGFAGTEFAQRMVNPLKVLVDIPGNIRYVRDVGGLISLGRRLCATLDETAKRVAENISSGVGAFTGSSSGVSWVHAWIGKVGKIGKLGKVVGLLMASTQTVPLTAVWMLHLVGNDDVVRERLRSELDDLAVRSMADLKYEHLGKMKFADAVIMETLRLYPPFPLIQREAQVNDVLGGITIAEGTPVYVVPWLVHRNRKYFADPHEFKPDRFINGNGSYGDAPSDWVYIPFGRGPRMCAGYKLAMAELKVLLAHAVLSYNWESWFEKGSKEGPFPELGMIPKGVQLQFRSRQDGIDTKSRLIDVST